MQDETKLGIYKLMEIIGDMFIFACIVAISYLINPKLTNISFAIMSIWIIGKWGGKQLKEKMKNGS